MLRALIWDVDGPLAEARRDDGERLAGGAVLRRGALPLLRAARSAGLMQGIATSVSRQACRRLLDACLGVEAQDLFDVVVCGEDVQARKPAPAVYQALTRYFGVAAADCVAFEDSFAGALAAGRAGMPCVLTSRGCIERAARAGMRVPDVLAILDGSMGVLSMLRGTALLDAIRRGHADGWTRMAGDGAAERLAFH